MHNAYATPVPVPTTTPNRFPPVTPRNPATNVTVSHPSPNPITAADPTDAPITADTPHTPAPPRNAHT